MRNTYITTVQVPETLAVEMLQMTPVQRGNRIVRGLNKCLRGPADMLKKPVRQGRQSRAVSVCIPLGTFGEVKKSIKARGGSTLSSGALAQIGWSAALNFMAPGAGIPSATLEAAEGGGGREGSVVHGGDETKDNPKQQAVQETVAYHALQLERALEEREMELERDLHLLRLQKKLLEELRGC